MPDGKWVPRELLTKVQERNTKEKDIRHQEWLRGGALY
jgi:hypothetical protein